MAQADHMLWTCTTNKAGNHPEKKRITLIGSDAKSIHRCCREAQRREEGPFGKNQEYL